MIKILLDTNAYDVIAADSAFKADIAELQAKGELEAIFTHVEEGELSLIPLERDSGQAQAVARRKVGTGVFVINYSRLDEDRFGTPEANALYEKLHAENSKHVEDAMIGSTALVEGATLVTNDRRFASRMAEHAPHLQVLDSEGLRILVRRLKTEASPAT